MIEALSASHPRVRRLRRLVQKRSLRWDERVCVLEGPDLIHAAWDAHADLEAIFVDAEHTDAPMVADVLVRAKDARARVYALEHDVFERVADASTPQPVLATVHLPLSDLDTLSGSGVVMVLHDLRDPGNAGTLIRSAAAAGATGVIFTGHSVDPFNPKTLRASAGSVFQVPVVVADVDLAISTLRERGFRIYATVLRGGRSHRAVDLTEPSAVVLGNEAEGLSDEVVAQCDESLTIEMVGPTESLNAGVAGSLLVFEALWQRRGTNPPPSPSSL